VGDDEQGAMVEFQTKLYLKSQFIWRSKHIPSQLLTVQKKIDVCSELHRKHTKTFCEQNVEFLMASVVVGKVTTKF
jgi:hypothetical protein